MLIINLYSIENIYNTCMLKTHFMLSFVPVRLWKHKLLTVDILSQNTYYFKMFLHDQFNSMKTNLLDKILHNFKINNS